MANRIEPKDFPPGTKGGRKKVSPQGRTVQKGKPGKLINPPSLPPRWPAKKSK